MAISIDLNDLRRKNYVESTSVPGQPVLTIANPDGTNIGSATGASANQMQGSAASGATNTGNPVKTGLVYNATPPTVSDGQVVDAQGDTNGNQKITMATGLTRNADSVDTNQYGTPTESVVSVGTSDTSVLSANSARKYLQLINDSANTIYVSIDGGASALNTGTRLNANGGSVIFDRYVPTNTVKAWASSASSTLLVTEG